MELAYEIKITGPIGRQGARRSRMNRSRPFCMTRTQFLETRVKENTPTGVGGEVNGLWATIHGEVVDKGTEVQKGIVAHSSVYGDPWSGAGRPGKMAPSSVLVRWVEVKFGVSGRMPGGSRSLVRERYEPGHKGRGDVFQGARQGWPQVMAMAERCGVTIADRMRDQ